MFEWEIEKALIDGICGGAENYTTATAANTSTASAITLESITEAFAKMPKLDPVSVTTPARTKFARQLGFPDWPGIKMGRGAYDELRKLPSANGSTSLPFAFGGIPVAVDDGMDRDSILTLGIPESK